MAQLKASSTVGGAFLDRSILKTANYTATSGDIIVADTSGGAFTITLPASPGAGEWVQILPEKASYAANNLTIGRNGKDINSTAENFLIDVDGVSVRFTYIDTTIGWLVEYTGDITGSAIYAGSTGPGTIVAWPGSTPPSGWFECNGATFTQSLYPNLYAALGDSTTIPDLRGEFIRGWDNGRGVDASRTIKSAQADQLQGHNHQHPQSSTVNGNVASPMATGGGGILRYHAHTHDAYVSDGINGTPNVGTETRARNIALMYIIKHD